MNEEQEQKSIQLRALLAFALAAVVLFAYQYFLVKPAPRGNPLPAVPAEPKAPPPAEAAAKPAPAAKKEGASAPPAAAASEQTFIVETDTFLVALSNRGAVVTSWTLKLYKNESGRPLELVNTASAAEAGYPFSVVARSNTPPVDVNKALFQVETTPAAARGTVAAPITLTFRWSDGSVTARKMFRFAKSSYQVEVESELHHNGAAVPHLLGWRGGFGDAAVADAANSVKTFYYDTTQGKVVRQEAKDAEKGPLLNAGNYLFAGVEDLYFAAAFLPADRGRPLELETSALETVTSHKKTKQLFAGAAVGSAGPNKFLAYVGPKNLQALRSVRAELEKLVDFGSYLWFIAYPLFVMLSWTHGWVPNFGWAIILVTIVINFLLFPLKLKSMQSMKKMQKLQPMVKQINDKFKNLSLRDPKRQEQNKEVMDLYSKYGVNPMGGCLPLLLQLPFFFAFYTVLTISIEMRHARWLWIGDLSARDAIFLLPILMIGTQFWYQKMTPTTSADPTQQKIMKYMPLVMGFFFYSLPSGLVLYWVTGNLVGIAQQWFINRLPEPVMEAEMAKKGKHKAKGNR